MQIWDRKGNYHRTERYRAQGWSALLAEGSLLSNQWPNTAQHRWCGLERQDCPKGWTGGQGERRGAAKLRSMLKLL